MKSRLLIALGFYFTCSIGHGEVPTLYAVENVVGESRLVTVDVATGAIGHRFPLQPYDQVNGLAYDSSTDTLFAHCRVSPFSSLFTIDRRTGAFSDIGRIDWIGGGIYDLAIHPTTHELFGITLLGDLLRVDKSTAEPTIVGSNAQFRYGHGLAFSPDGRLFASDTEGVGSKLFEIDPTTGVATFLRRISSDYVIGLSFHPDGTLYGNDSGPRSLIRIDPDSGEVSTIGAFNETIIDHVFVDAIAFVVPEPCTEFYVLCLSLASVTAVRVRAPS